LEISPGKSLREGDLMRGMVEFRIKIPVKITKRERWFLASCPVLDLHSQGETEKKAQDNLGEAMRVFFASCFERGILDEVLKKCGFKLASATNPLPPPRGGRYIDIPLPFMTSGQSRQCLV